MENRIVMARCYYALKDNTFLVHNVVDHKFVNCYFHNKAIGLLLDHLVEIACSVVHDDAEGVGTRGQVAHADAFKAFAL